MAGPVAGKVEPDFPAVHVLDGGGVAGERPGDQVDQARLANAGSAGDQELEDKAPGIKSGDSGFNLLIAKDPESENLH